MLAGPDRKPFGHVLALGEIGQVDFGGNGFDRVEGQVQQAQRYRLGLVDRGGKGEE